MDTVKRMFRVDRREIAYLRFIFEAYDGLAVVTTLDPQSGIVAFHISPGCEDDVQQILEDLGKDLMIEPLKDQPPEAQMRPVKGARRTRKSDG